MEINNLEIHESKMVVLKKAAMIWGKTIHYHPHHLLPYTHLFTYYQPSIKLE